MDYLDCYQILKKDHFIENIIREQLRGQKKQIKPGERIFLEKDRILLIDRGALVLCSGNTFLRSFKANDYLHAIDLQKEQEDKMLLEAMEHTIFREYCAQEFLQFLEQKQLLSNFFLQELEKAQKWSYTQANRIIISTEERVISVLQELVERFGKQIAHGKVILPRWIKIVTLAKLSGCSRNMASRSIQYLKKQGILTQEKSLWKINEKALANLYY
ncbi:Crp/Fnr family transcriptional regulator [Listeria valentina]|uniref:Crp/Fnr family transcriptional regulator n=1 Tax=Listeria valentina TaxID=2705293 RepID=UPI00142F81B3|nr:Crp/Fnr family transcriptional regulator [Listeria valentina]